MTAVKSLPAVGRIQGLQVRGSREGNPADAVVELQYTAHTPQEQWFSLELGLPDALYLLNLLEAMSQDGGFDRLRRPSA